MRVIIIGAGKIGFIIAKILVEENYDVVVIEKLEERANTLQEYLDVEVIVGNGVKTSILEEAGIREAGLLVAVTESDETNLIACMLAKNFGVAKTIAKVKNPEYILENKKDREMFLG